MARPNPRFDTPVLTEIERLHKNYLDYENQVGVFKAGMNPSQMPVPSWWQGGIGIGSTPTWSDPTYHSGNPYSNEEALQYLNIAEKVFQLKLEWRSAQCADGKEPVYCSYASDIQGTLGRIHGLQNQVRQVMKKDSKAFEILPQVFAEEEQLTLSSNVQQIINDINNNIIQIPDWFRNNIEWVQSGHITEQEFLTAYNYLADQQIPIIDDTIVEPTINESITDNMVTQQVINFNIINGRAVGSIKFVATNNFNPFWYGQNIVNLVQFKTPNGVTLVVKENRLNFTETERDEIISYDENVSENTRITVESFVWSSATTPTPFSKTSTIDISEGDLPKITTSGFMAAGVAGAIAGLVLLGFIVDSKVGK